jgi:hypothetical protein
MTLHLSAIAHRSDPRRDLDHAGSAADRALGLDAPRGVRAMLWVIIASALAAAFALALAFVQ